MLGVVRPLAVDLRVRRGGLGGRVDDGVGFVDGEEFVDEGFLREVALHEREVVEVVDLAGGLEAGVDAGDRLGGDAADFLDPLPTREVIDEDDAVVGAIRDAEGGGPAEVAVGAGEEDFHRYSSSESLFYVISLLEASAEISHD